MQTIGITGGTGFIGHHLANHLVSNGYKVIIFTRDVAGHTPGQFIDYALWDTGSKAADINAFKQLDGIIHLAGAGIADKRWTKDRKKEIRDSRVDGTQYLVRLLKEHAPGCKTFISASAIGYYGPDNGNSPFTETAPHYNDFLSNVCVQWEQASNDIEPEMRRVIFRFGIVLGKESGAFPQFANPVKWGVMPVLGGGQQVISWIHIADLTGMILFALQQNELTGVYNAVAPQPVSQKAMMQTIGHSLGGIRIPVPVPAAALKLAMGEMSIEVLKSATVSCQKIVAAGFNFQYSSIEQAVADILK
ncbi:MAG: TIGR01777 family protein [Bacteroidetes bacterium 43-93]|nr:TIGR01777 family oxidoreductase [Bacteroidota bacterium]OJX00095.1 MAG: TIGR01777 family protein [Bacteroidetes bacterium 43-93]